jgi:lipoate-protein ligase A
LLYAFDVKQVVRYLRIPARQPDYRAVRSHQDFLTNLPLQRDEIVARLRREFEASEEIGDWPVEEVGRLMVEKYSREEWTRRR